MSRAASTILACLLVSFMQAQDADLLFAGQVPMLLDPSRTGFDPGGRITLLHQDQWLQMPGAWRTEALATEWSLKNKHKEVHSWMGLGLVAVRDNQLEGAQQLSSAGLVPAVHLRAGRRSFLSTGLEIHWANRAMGLDDGQWGSQYNGQWYDAALPSGEKWAAGSQTSLETRAGLSFTLKQEEESRFRRERNVLVAGISADHIGKLALRREGQPLPDVPVRFTAYTMLELPFPAWDNGFLGGEVRVRLQGPFHTGRINIYTGKHLLNAKRTAGGPPLLGFKAGLGYQYNNAVLVNASMDWGPATFGMAYGWALFGRDVLLAGRRTFELLVQFRMSGEGG